MALTVLFSIIRARFGAKTLSHGCMPSKINTQIPNNFKASRHMPLCSEFRPFSVSLYRNNLHKCHYQYLEMHKQKQSKYTISLKYVRISCNATHYISIIEIIKPEVEMLFAKILKQEQNSHMLPTWKGVFAFWCLRKGE